MLDSDDDQYDATGKCPPMQVQFLPWDKYLYDLQIFFIIHLQLLTTKKLNNSFTELVVTSKLGISYIQAFFIYFNINNIKMT